MIHAVRFRALERHARWSKAESYPKFLLDPNCKKSPGEAPSTHDCQGGVEIMLVLGNPGERPSLVPTRTALEQHGMDDIKGNFCRGSRARRPTRTAT
jgi:hypothetical protein